MTEPWTGWWDQFTGDADKSVTVEASSEVAVLVEALQVRTDQRDQLKQRLDEIKAAALKAHGGPSVSKHVVATFCRWCRVLDLIDKPLGGAE